MKKSSLTVKSDFQKVDNMHDLRVTWLINENLKILKTDIEMNKPFY